MTDKSEQHVGFTRRENGLQEFHDNQAGFLYTRQILKEYLSGDGANINTVMSRGETIHRITEERFWQVERN